MDSEEVSEEHSLQASEADSVVDLAVASEVDLAEGDSTRASEVDIWE